MSENKSKKDIAGIAIIGLFELLVGFTGICIFASALVAISGFALPGDLATDLIASRLYKAGIAANLSLVWAIMYIGLLPVGVAMLVRKEWARTASRRLLPLCLLMAFPLFFPSFKITAQKLRILHGLSRAIHIEDAFWPYFFRDIQPWLMFVVVMLCLSFLLRKYLNEAPVKALFK